MTQQQAIDCMMSGRNVFMTGAPGAGKTYTLNSYIEQAERKRRRIAITASTGIAASHLNGVTIHSWSGLGIKDQLTDEDLDDMASNGRIVKRYVQCDVLIIDEVSMLHGFRLDMVNRVAKRIRRNDQPFGGLQVILVGDLFQLPPVTRDSSFLDFVHLSASWRELDLAICYITEQHRQEGEDLLLDLLVSMRANDVRRYQIEALQGRMVGGAADTVTRLYTHNADVDTLNRRKLNALTGKLKKFRMHTAGDPVRVEALTRNILAPDLLELRKHAEVMFVANNFELGYVNGTRGRVIDFVKGSSLPMVELADGRVVIAERHTWTVKEFDRVIAQAEQIPLRLAWAITVHKSQGMSLDAAEVDLSRAFTPSMGYVALSRVRSLDGLYLTGINKTALSMHREIYEFDAVLRELSAAESGQQ